MLRFSYIKEDRMSHRILIVDDEALCREPLKCYLTEAGYVIDEAENGLQAYELLAARPRSYSAVLLDWMMPAMTGIELVEKLQQTEGLAKIPVVMLTSVDEQDRIMAAVQAGVFDYLVKPVDRDLLVPMIAKAIELRSTVSG
jgi:DNA-binding response OmpR family regulator